MTNPKPEFMDEVTDAPSSEASGTDCAVSVLTICGLTYEVECLTAERDAWKTRAELAQEAATLAGQVANQLRAEVATLRPIVEEALKRPWRGIGPCRSTLDDALDVYLKARAKEAR